MNLLVEVMPLDDDAQIGRELALVLEFPENGVVILDELEMDVGSKVFRVGADEAVPPADERSGAVDQQKVVEEELLPVHSARRPQQETVLVFGGARF